MSRTLARILHGLTGVVTVGQSPAKRAATVSRVMERFDLAPMRWRPSMAR